MASEPKHLVVLRDLRMQITGGRWGPDEQLPTEEELAAAYGVSRQTIRRAFQDLVADGLVDRTRGRGTFAKPSGALYLRQMGSIDDLLALSSDTTMEILTPLQVIVDVSAAGRLRLGGDRVGRVSFVRIHAGVRFCETQVFLPPVVAQSLIERGLLDVDGGVSEATVIGLLEENKIRHIAEAHQSITAEPAGPAAAAILGCPAGQPLLRIDRVYLDDAGDPVELATSRFVSAHYSYRTILRRTR